MQGRLERLQDGSSSPAITTSPVRRTVPIENPLPLSSKPVLASAVERELVLRLASVLWRLRRATGIETALFESMAEDSHRHDHRRSRENRGKAADLAHNRLFLRAMQESDAAEGNELSSDSKTNIADCFLRLAVLPTGALDRLSRYEYLLWRQARQIVFTLESLRRQATADPFSLSIFVPAARARCRVRRVQVTTREVNAAHRPPGLLRQSSQPCIVFAA
jgi:hypothetical protein